MIMMESSFSLMVCVFIVFILFRLVIMVRNLFGLFKLRMGKICVVIMISLMFVINFDKIG